MHICHFWHLFTLFHLFRWYCLDRILLIFIICSQNIPNTLRSLLYSRIVLSNCWSLLLFVHFVSLFSWCLLLEARMHFNFSLFYLWDFLATGGAWGTIAWFCFWGVVASAFAEETETGGITGIDYHAVLFINYLAKGMEYGLEWDKEEYLSKLNSLWNDNYFRQNGLN